MEFVACAGAKGMFVGTVVVPQTLARCTDRHKCNFDRRIVVVCCPELERVRPVIVRGSTAPPAQVHQ